MSELNSGTFTGTVEDLTTQFVPSGQMKALLKLTRTETWATGSRDVHAEFEFFGKSAEFLDKKDIKKGDTVKVTYELGSWAGKDKATGQPNGKHFVTLKGWKTEVISAAPESSIPF